MVAAVVDNLNSNAGLFFLQLFLSFANRSWKTLVSKADMGSSENSTNAECKTKMSAIESQIATARQRRATLEEDLTAQKEIVSNMEITLELTRANICIMQGRYDREVECMRSLEEELRASTALLEDAEATQLKEEPDGSGASHKGRFKPFKSARKSFGAKSPKKE